MGFNLDFANTTLEPLRGQVLTARFTPVQIGPAVWARVLLPPVLGAFPALIALPGMIRG